MSTNLLEKYNLPKIYVTLLKFGEWKVHQTYFAFWRAIWTCTKCEQKIMIDSTNENYAAEIATHILSHGIISSYHPINERTYDTIYFSFITILASYHISVTLYDSGIMRITRNIFGKEINMAYDYRCDTSDIVDLLVMDNFTYACVFCGFKYMCVPTDEIIIEHASTCFSTTCVKSHK